MKTALIVAAILIGLFLLTRGKKSKAKPVSTPALVTSVWRFLHCHGMPDGPTPNGEGCSFDFPRSPSSVNYLVRGNTLPLDRIAARFTVTGGGFVPQEAPSEQALVSLIAYVGETRYFSRNAIPLVPGTFTLAASAWITADGKPASPPTPDRIGLVFGWEAGRGHGVYAAQRSSFALAAIDVTR